MKVAYVDTSCVVSIALGEPGSAALLRRLKTFDDIVSSNLLEAEVLVTFARERIEPDPTVFRDIAWILPERPLHDEIGRVLSNGYLRGADCWHLATALFIAPEPSSIAFVTLDARQRAVARALGFGE